MARTGRRPGRADTRAEVLAAARQEFAAKGYAGATIRGIAAAAGVDPALVHHYFGTKRELFVVSLALPFDPVEIVAAVRGDSAAAGERDELSAFQLRSIGLTLGSCSSCSSLTTQSPAAGRSWDARR